MRPKTILIADDDRDLTAALSIRCRRLGLAPRVVHDALSALNAIHDRPPDVVCLDFHMPRGNGLSVCEMLANSALGAKIPVVVLTGRGDPEIVRRCHQLCAYYVPKCADVWSRLEPLLVELLELDNPQSRMPDGGAAASETDQA